MDWIKDNKKYLISTMIFFLIFITTFIVSYVIGTVWCDEVWLYGFSYNISKGMIIYRDFNAVPTPLYFIMASLFIKLFGPHMISTCIFNSLLMASIGLIIIKILGWKGIFPILVNIVLVTSPYNLLCAFFLFIILYLINKDKYNDLLVAFIVGLIFVTKQNIGVLLFIPMFFYSKNKIKSIIVFLIPFILLCIYFLFNKALFNFIDYSFLGLFEFSNNLDLNTTLFITELLCIAYLFYSLIKSKFKDKEAFYILLFQLLIYPICDNNHFAIAFMAFLYYFLKTCKISLVKNTICILECIYLITAFYIFNFPINIHTEKDLLYLRNPSKIANILNDYYKKYDGDIENIYFDSELSYLLKLYYNVPIDELDLTTSGNLGYYSKNKIYKKLENHCQKEKCYFIIHKDCDKTSQYYEYNMYIKKHYIKMEEYQGMDVYSSK